MAVELKIPAVGESVTEAFVGRWLRAEGEYVEKDAPVAELETDKANFELFAPVSGTVTKQLKKEGDAAKVGETIGWMQEGAAQKLEAPAAASAPEPPRVQEREPVAKPAEPPAPKAPEPKTAQVVPAAAPLPKQPEPEQRPAESVVDGEIELQPRVMPAARRALAEYGLSPDEVKASGPGGRLLKEDVLRHVGRKAAPEPAPAKIAPVAAEPAQLKAPSVPAGGRADEIVRMTPMRQTIARRLVEAQQTMALLTTFNEVDMTGVMQLRAEYRDAFEKKYGIRLGFMSFFVKAAIDALQQFPAVNAEIRGDTIVYHQYYDIGVAVSTDRGLVVPVVRNADRLSFAELEMAIADLSKRARERRLELSELQGGTFTVTNGGVFGSLLSTPIINPPQSGVLGMHAVQERPVARDGQVVIRPMMYVALTYDHRMIDGREAVSFLKRIKQAVEDPIRMLIEV